jgi:hypothetical protein
MWEPRPLTPLWAFTACYRDSFTFFFYFTSWVGPLFTFIFICLAQGTTGSPFRHRNTSECRNFMYSSPVDNSGCVCKITSYECMGGMELKFKVLLKLRHLMQMYDQLHEPDAWLLPSVKYNLYSLLDMINPLERVVIIFSTCFNTLQHPILRTLCICVFGMVLTVNRDCSLNSINRFGCVVVT